MNRNQMNRFDTAPSLISKRTKFILPTFNHKTTFNMGELIPFYVDTDIMPAETDSISTTMVIRMPSPPEKPIMDDLYVDYYYFFDALRNQWDHFREFMGENREGVWAQETEYTVPQIICDSIPNPENPEEIIDRAVKPGSPMDYMGMPINKAGISFNAFGMRTYARVWNWFFRDQNYQEPVEEYDGDEDRALTETDNEIPFAEHCAPVFKFHDYFTSLIPQAQKGESVMLPIGTEAPVFFSEDSKAISVSGTIGTGQMANTVGGTGIKLGFDNNTTAVQDIKASTSMGSSVATLNASLTGSVGLDNLGGYADLSTATAATVNALRMAFQVQKILERDARGGTRIDEVIYSHYGATLPDSQWKPVYLGGKRVPISISQVIQTSETGTTQLGNTGSYSITATHQKDFTKSFAEWGVIMGVLCVRQRHTYQQGIHAMWSRRRRLDYYWPELAHIGEQGVKSKELCAIGNSETDEEIIGFKEAWSEIKSTQNRISGQFRSNCEGTLDIWHLGDYYEEGTPPTISKEFLKETPEYLDRAILVPSTEAHSFIADIAVDVTKVLPMPMFSIPGMIDHF